METSRAVSSRRKACRSPELIQQICSLLAQGFSLRYCCSELGFSAPFFFDWLCSDPEVSKQYARARENQAEYLADEIVEISDTEKDSAKARNRIDARKWVAAKLLPKKYGDNQAQLNFSQTIVMSVEEQKELQERRRRLLEE